MPRLHGDRLSHLHFPAVCFGLLGLPREQEGAVSKPPGSAERGCSCPAPTLPPEPPGPLPHTQPPSLPSPRRPSGISCQRPWSRSSEAMGSGPSHSRAAESFEKNASRSWEDLLRTVRLCGGSCCSALSPPRPRGGAKPSLQTPSLQPGAQSPERGAGAGPGAGGAGRDTDRTSSRPETPSPPTG